jgi:hypothetical protein
MFVDPEGLRKTSSEQKEIKSDCPEHDYAHDGRDMHVLCTTDTAYGFTPFEKKYHDIEFEPIKIGNHPGKVTKTSMLKTLFKQLMDRNPTLVSSRANSFALTLTHCICRAELEKECNWCDGKTKDGTPPKGTCSMTLVVGYKVTPAWRGYKTSTYSELDDVGGPIHICKNACKNAKLKKTSAMTDFISAKRP